MARRKKTKSQSPNQKSIPEFVNEERQKKIEQMRKEHEQYEAEIFEHLKQHTKRVLNYEKERKKR